VQPSRVAVAGATIRRVTSQSIRFCTSFDGTHLAYAVTGAGPPLVRAPHWLTHLEYEFASPIWRPWISTLSAAHRLLRMDMRACGLSDRDVADFSFDAYVRDLEAVVDAAGFTTPFVLLGHSQSAAIAIAYAAAHPERVQGLILYGTSYHRPRASTMRLLRAMVRHWGEGRIVDVYAPSIANAEIRSAAGAFERAAASPAMARALVESLGLTDVRDRLPELAVPTLVLHREADFVPIEDGRAVAARIPSAKLVVLSGRDHLPWVGDWAAVVAQVLGFLAGVAPSGTRSKPSRAPSTQPPTHWLKAAAWA